MRSQPRSWTSLFTKLGIRRKKRNSRPINGQRRKLRFEQFEDRCMLAAFTVNVDYDVNTFDINDSIVTLREAVDRADATQAPDIINFASSLDGATITLGIDEFGNNLNFSSLNGDLDITESVTIDASMLTSLTVDASGNDNDVNVDDGGGSRIFDISGSGLVTLDGLTLTGGDVTGSGGAISTTASLEIKNSVISNNHAEGISGFQRGTGGGIHGLLGNAETATISNSTITGNSTSQLPPGYSGPYGGGGLFFDLRSGSNLTIQASVIDNNQSDFGGGGANLGTAEVPDRWGLYSTACAA